MRAVLTSLSCMANRQTIFVSFVLLPFIQMLLIVMIQQQFSQSFAWEIVVASITVSGVCAAINNMTSLFAYDQNFNIDKELLVQGGFSIYYWGGKIAIAFGSALILVLSNLAIISLFGKGDIPFVLGITLTIPLLCSGVVIGFVCAVGSWRHKNPYLWSNCLLPFVVILSGVLVPITQYPTWLNLLSSLFPFGNTISLLTTQSGSIVKDQVITFLWLVAGVAIYQYKVKQLKK